MVTSAGGDGAGRPAAMMIDSGAVEATGSDGKLPVANWKGDGSFAELSRPIGRNGCRASRIDSGFASKTRATSGHPVSRDAWCQGFIEGTASGGCGRRDEAVEVRAVVAHDREQGIAPAFIVAGNQIGEGAGEAFGFLATGRSPGGFGFEKQPGARFETAEEAIVARERFGVGLIQAPRWAAWAKTAGGASPTADSPSRRASSCRNWAMKSRSTRPPTPFLKSQSTQEGVLTEASMRARISRTPAAMVAASKSERRRSPTTPSRPETSRARIRGRRRRGGAS
jgi:hypothetical protein